MPGSKRSPREKARPGAPRARRATYPWDEPTHRQLVESLRLRRQELAALHVEYLDAQRVLELSQDEYVELFDLGPLPCFILDASGIIGRSNAAAAALLALDRSRLANAPMVVFVRDADRRLFLEHMRRCRQSHGLVSTELTLRTRAGIEIPIELSSRVLSSHATGNPVYQTFAIDLRERRRLEADRQRAVEERRRLEHEQRVTRAASEAKDRFLAMLSHELRTPLTPIVLATSAWKDDASLSNPLRQTLAMIHRNITIEARLIDDLLDLTRIVQNKLALDSTPVDLHALAADVVDSLQGEPDAAEITFALTLESGGYVRGDALRLRQVIWNLVRNALHATPPGGQVRVETRDAPRGRVQLAVRDNGIGFDAETHARMFEPFDQGTHPDRKLGLGLGLAISRGFVEAQGGTIAAFSDGPGCGATLLVELPAARPPVAAPLAEPSPPRELGRPGPLRILLVDDHKDTCVALSYVLQHEGYAVEIAHSVAQALAAATAVDVDMLVSDLGLPDGSGLDLMRTLKARKPMPGIALTGYGRGEDVADSREAGFERHLTKPVDVATLIAAIESLRADQT